MLYRLYVPTIIEFKTVLVTGDISTHGNLLPMLTEGDLTIALIDEGVNLYCVGLNFITHILGRIYNFIFGIKALIINNMDYPASCGKIKTGGFNI